MTDDGLWQPATEDALLYESVDDLYENAPCGYLSTTPDGVIVKANRTFLSWSGYGRDELLGRTRFADLLRVGGKLYYETHFAPLLQMQGVANEIAFDLVRKDGHILPTLVSAIQRRDASGQPVVQRMTVFNATERRQYEQELLWAKQAAEQAAADLRQILDVLPVAVLIVDADGHTALANAAAQELGGRVEPAGPARSVESALVDNLWLRRPDGTPYPADELPLQQSLHAGDVVRGREALIHPIGSERPMSVLVSSAPLHGAEGGITGAVAVYQDVTPLKDLERAREEFLGAAAHDLKTPLTSVQGLAQLARRRLGRLTLPEAMPIVTHLDGIDAGTQRMARLIDELVDITRLQMGALLELHLWPTDVVALARAVVSYQHGSTGHRLMVDTALPNLIATVDADRIERVLSNLLGNAIKYSPASGEITVQVTREDDRDASWAVLVVRDTGLGIPAADLPHIFERYYRADNVRGRIQGTGIGLASVRQIVEQHGGTVTVESTEGVGSTVTVRLPLAHPSVDRGASR